MAELRAALSGGGELYHQPISALESDSWVRELSADYIETAGWLEGRCAPIDGGSYTLAFGDGEHQLSFVLRVGLADGVPHLLRTEGVAGLYAGWFSTCLKQGGNQGSRFFYMAQWRLFMAGYAEAKLPRHVTFAGGLGAGLFSVLWTGRAGNQNMQHDFNMQVFARFRHESLALSKEHDPSKHQPKRLRCGRAREV